ncbi:MAG: molecular chaperone DnaJ [Robiginitomaculum sp.]|nr:MAG: molecular chaperone DnaJ [Robiginitomaculum sp.]
MAKDPYKLLGVSKSTSDKDIKKAYRALAKKWHPDKNKGNEKAAERFKEISAAYTLLSDKDLRAQYDSGGIDASGQQQHPFGGQAGGMGGGYRNASGAQMGGDMSDLFASLFGMQMGGHPGQAGGPQFRRPPPRPQKGADVRYTLSITLPEAVAGATKQVRMSDGKQLKISIPEGTNDDTTLRLRGKGSPGVNGGPAGDAKITISVKAHKYLRRDGNNLRLDLPITLQEAVLGGKITVPTPKGNINLSVKPGSSSGKTLRLKGKGVKGGDLLVRLMINLPEDMGDDLKKCVGAWEDQPDPRRNMNINMNI